MILKVKNISNNLRPFVLYLFLISTILLITHRGWFLKSYHKPVGTKSMYVYDFDMDYFTYLYFIREGMDGSWAVEDLYTTEPSAYTSNYLFYILLGKLTAALNLDPVAGYHLSRLLFLYILFILIYRLALKFLNRNIAITGILTGLISAPIFFVPGYRFFGEGATGGIPIAFWYTSMVFRISLIPHHAASSALILAAVLFYFSYFENKNIFRLAAAIFSEILSVVFHPISAVFMVIIMPVSVLLWSIKNRKTDVYRLLSAGFLALTGLAALLFVKIQSETGYPWNLWTRFDIDYFNQFPNFSWEYIYGESIIYFLSIPSVIFYVLFSKNLLKTFIGIWALSGSLLIFAAHALGFAKFRVVFLLSYIPLGLCAIKTVSDLASRIKNNYLKYTGSAIICIVFCYLSFPAWKFFHTNRENIYKIPKNNQYIPYSVINALNYLKLNQSRKYPNVLADDTLSLAIPAIIPVKVFTAHHVYTGDYGYKLNLTRRFFGMEMSNEEARDLIRNYQINYIFYNFKVQINDFDPVKYGISMKIIYNRDNIVICEIL